MGGSQGREPGNGRIVVAEFNGKEGEGCGWEVLKTIEIPATAAFTDYSGMAFRGNKVREMRCNVDKTAHAGVLTCRSSWDHYCMSNQHAVQWRIGFKLGCCDTFSASLAWWQMVQEELWIQWVAQLSLTINGVCVWCVDCRPPSSARRTLQW